MTYRLLNKKKAAEMLTVSVITFDRIRKQEGFPTAVRIGGSLRWRDDHLESWINRDQTN